ncbi:MAG: DMT family transporter [Bacillota bacterium]|jgi:drug/metabolite transporter (DMT)-like permease
MEPANSPPINPLLVLALGVVGVSFSAIFVRMTSAPATVTAFYRLFFTCLLLTPLALRNRRQFRALNKGDLLLCLLSGMFLSFHFVLWFASLGLTSISSAALLVNIHPLLVVGAGWRLFGEKFRPSALPWAGLAVAGMAVLGWGDFQSGGTALSGNLLAAAGAAMLAGYYLLGRIARARISISAYSLLVYGTSALLLLAYNLASSAPLSGFPATDWLAFAGLAVLPTLCGHTLLNWALKYLPASAISVGVLGEPIIATILALPFYGEIPGPLQLAGGALAVAGIWMFLRRS